MKIDIPMEVPKGRTFYPWLGWYFTNILVPYPLYIITTVDRKGIPNAQPNIWGLPYGSEDMQMFLFSTWTMHHAPENILDTEEFVVNIPSKDVVTEVMKTVEHYPRGVDEIEASGLTGLPSRSVKPPRIKECKAHFECKYLWSKSVRVSDTVEDITIAGHIVAASADEDVLCGSTEGKLAAMRTPYIVETSVDAKKWKLRDVKMCGTISELEDFLKMMGLRKQDWIPDDDE